MTKSEVVWLIIRLAGVYFLWQALETAVGFLTGAGLAIGPRPMVAGSAVVLVGMLLKATFYTVLGFYCIGNGRLLFRVLGRESAG
ncbi:MAG TPA: hypothetical protein VF588_04385 [Pyrinomonadaceae bacterium]|jgi:hypothetical protein